MKIRVDLKIFIFLLIFILTKQIKIYSVIMLFALVHEVGHLIAGLLLGFKSRKIDIMPYGFSIEFDKKLCDSATKKSEKKIAIKRAIIAAAGPITNFFIIIATVIISLTTKNASTYSNLEMIVYANTIVMVFNLIPIYPMDGGRIIKEIIYVITESKNTEKYINTISNISLIIITALTSILVLFYKNFAVLFVIIYLWYINIRRNNFFERERIAKMYNK